MIDVAVASASAAGIDLEGRRLWLVAPHPDDESLALGGLVQHALRHGAQVTLLHVTDGDNNPWPQRWLERRWRIKAVDRARWGTRRAGEARAAVQHLGLPGAALQRLAWPDLGVCGRLLDQRADAVATFADALQRAAPDVVVFPDLADRHPDHGACHVLVRLALAQLGFQPTCLTYLVHGSRAHAGAPVAVALDADMRAAKRRAVLAHRTQVALSRRRLLAMVGDTETLYRLPPPAAADADALPDRVALPWRIPQWPHPWLRLVVVHPDGAHAWRWSQAPLHADGGRWRLALPVAVRRRPVFAHLALTLPSPWIFDHWGWCDLTAEPSSRQAGP